jgi:hypothetical protein
VEHLIADETITHFFVENHLVENSRSEQVFNDWPVVEDRLERGGQVPQPRVALGQRSRTW